jgi:Cytosine/adenosine deaminases
VSSGPFDDWMGAALDVAARTVSDVPVGALAVDADDTLLASAANEREAGDARPRTPRSSRYAGPVSDGAAGD